MTRITPDQARQLVNGLREKNGGITPADRERTPESVLRALEEVRDQLGRSIRTIARDLYTSDSRFVFELIQNAEDNSYARAYNETPFIKFTLRPGKIIVENNEDGFAEENVESICKINHSSKANQQGYIGEKGIGFKSVFQVAHRVEIRSGPFDFYFEHRPEDSGMGMITPMNQETPSPSYNGTQMTLFLIEPDDFQRRVQDFASIPDPLILFLSKLQRIEVSIQMDKNSSNVIYECLEDENDSITKLVKNVDNTISEKSYYIVKETFSDLPPDAARKNRNSAEVILAFPITEDSRPIIEPQKVFSFLPVRDFGFKFLIQSDFITSANREDVRVCNWNDDLLQHVCTVFASAVDEFNWDPVLQYEWLFFLPGNSIHHQFWDRLHGMIIQALSSRPILLSRRGVEKYPRQLQRLLNRHCDRYGQPLFDDLEDEVYLSPNYHSEHISYLKDLGVTNVSWDNIIERLAPYLTGENPRFLQSELDEDWHSRVASLLIRALKDSGRLERIKAWIRELALIPLQNGSLSHNLENDVYFPIDLLGHPVPLDLGLKLVDEHAFANDSRKTLYEALQVEYCDPEFIIKKIERKYNTPFGVNLENSVFHLKYLYWNLPREQKLDKKIFLMNQDEIPVYKVQVLFGRSCTVDDIYFDTIGDFGTRHLAEELRSTVPSNESSGIHLINDAYLNAVSSDEEREDFTWKRWLESNALVRKVPRLRRPSTTGISPLFKIIITYRPMLLVGILKRYWDTYAKELNPEIIQEIKNAEVPCSDPEIDNPLKAAYFPTARLTSIVERSCASDYFDLFLDIVPASESIETAAGWEFLTKFDVGIKPDLRFFKDILSTLTEEASGTQLQTGLFYVYEQLSEGFRLENRDSIRAIFNELNVVCLPARGIHRVKVTALRSCIWNGLPFLRVKDPLVSYPEYRENARVKYLFSDILGLEDANCTTYVTELKSLRRRTTSIQLPFDEICEIYAEIANIANTDEDHEFVSNAFEEHNLIYIPSEQVWVPPTSCVWTDSATIGRQYGISALYGDLQSFLVERLRVQTPTIATYVEQLLLVAAEVPPRMLEIKKAISAINDLNPTRANLEAIKQIKCLPVRTVQGTMELMRSSEEFFIGDRREYESVFRGKVGILDFSLEEVHDIHPFLEALELEDRYMSVAVQEITRVQEPSDNESRTLSQHFRAKSKAFFRCALHYRSVKVHNSGQEIYHTFQNASIYKSEGFTKTLALSYRGITVTAASDRGVFHLEGTEEALQLFVPRDNKQREKCYLTQLPKALMSYLLIDDPRAVKVFLLVIQASVHVLDEVLDEEGIVRVPDGYLPSSEQEDVSIEEDSHSDAAVDSPDNFPSRGTDALMPRSTRLSASTHTSGYEVLSATSYSRTSSPYVDVERVDRRRVLEPSSSDLVPNRETATDAQTSLTQVSLYVRFLTRIIQIARRTGLRSILARSVRSMGNGQTLADDALHEELAGAFGTRSENQLAHDIKLGAAGELFVFELLLQFGLPGFNRYNWKSKIRKEIRVHPEYHDLPPWSGEEISDISYIDSESVLTNLLIENGHLSANRWRGATPEYLIEVKSTTGVCENAFYMSKSQYRRMQRHKLDAELLVAESTIYVIFRVFDLGKDTMNLRIYIDPESLRVQDRLRFTPESYNVVPGAS